MQLRARSKERLVRSVHPRAKARKASSRERCPVEATVRAPRCSDGGRGSDAPTERRRERETVLTRRLLELCTTVRRDEEEVASEQREVGVSFSEPALISGFVEPVLSGQASRRIKAKGT